MKFVSDPCISTKIRSMKRRVRWQQPEILQYDIDQTRLVLKDTTEDFASFSFLVIGDSGTGYHRGDNPQRRVAKWIMECADDAQFILHTGDLVYLVGARHQYRDNFIRPYREWLVGGENPDGIQYDQMVFKIPFLPVPGNHDYYNVPLIYGLLSLALWPLRWLLRRQVDLDYGRQGSHSGDVYARAFIDYLAERRLTQGYGSQALQLSTHLKKQYRAKTETGMALLYEPDEFTRLPNRYYTFRQGGIDFFALDSNTFNAPFSMTDAPQSESRRQQLIAQRQAFIKQKEQVSLASLDTLAEEDREILTHLEQLDEQIQDIDKQLATWQTEGEVDWEQLDWLKQRLIASWQNEAVRGRIIYFHHPPYVTEATKWNQGQTLAIRHRLRQVLDDVRASLETQRTQAVSLSQSSSQANHVPVNRPIVDLVISGHAHCFEYLQTLDTGHADAYTHWLICGGSGFSLRRQRPEGEQLEEVINEAMHPVAKSVIFIGRKGHRSDVRRPYSGLKIDVDSANPPTFSVHPCIAEKVDGHWRNTTLDPIIIHPATLTEKGDV